MLVILAHIVKSLLQVARDQPSILTRVTGVIGDLVGTFPFALFTRSATTINVGFVGTGEDSYQIVIILARHYKISIMCREGQMSLIVDRNSRRQEE